MECKSIIFFVAHNALSVTLLPIKPKHGGLMKKKQKSRDIDGWWIAAEILKVIAKGILFYSLGMILMKIFLG